MVSPLPTIVTLAQAKKAANITTVDGDDDLYLRLEAAHEAVLEYVNNRLADADEWADTIVTWDEDTAPKQIRAAILQMFCFLQRFRGDDGVKDQPELKDGDLPASVRMYLKRFRDPTVA